MELINKTLVINFYSFKSLKLKLLIVWYVFIYTIFYSLKNELNYINIYKLCFLEN